MSRYLIGIDLGTTNTVVHYIDRTSDDNTPQTFKIPQVTAAGEVDECTSLPSFAFLSEGNDITDGALDLPWAEGLSFSVGEFAREQASLLPGKVVSSAKSWLCADNLNPEEAILPWQSANATKWSPVQATQAYLEHLKAAWNEFLAESEDDSFEKQQLVITVPASFDALARELTLKAANAAGLNPLLLEEPLAAFYAWLTEHGEDWRDQVNPGDVILICDIGGGTTDFSLIQAIENEGNLELERIAVGDHILLGGDNMDLTIAYQLAAKLQRENNTTLNPYQITGLTHACRKAKEILLTDENAEPQPITVLGQGSSLIGGTITTSLNREELDQWLMEGFFPACELGEELVTSTGAGFRQMGLNYAADPAVTKHLSAFLLKNAEICLPNCIFFNGGVTKADVIRERILGTVQSWLAEDSPELRVLAGSHPDMAVSAGATTYGLIREGEGIRVKSGSAHTYFIGIESTMPAIPGFTPPVQGLCVVPFGMEEGTDAEVPYQGLGMVVGDEAQFRLYVSTGHHELETGTVLPDLNQCADITELPPVSTVLEMDDETTPGTLIPVALRSELTETGLLQMWCEHAASDKSWKLSFNLRAE